MKKMGVAVGRSFDNLRLEFSGNIDEDANFQDVNLEDVKKVVFDLGAVSALNSCGIREWVKFVEGINSQVELIFEKCSRVVIDQANMVAGFFPEGAVVESFFAPYFCENCDRECELIMEPSAMTDFDHAPQKHCEDCGQQLEFDGIEDQYFRLVKQRFAG